MDTIVLNGIINRYAPLVHVDRIKKGDMRFAESVRLEWVDIW